MAIFNFRWPSSQGREKQAPANARKAPAESVEAMRRRARHRLVGAAVLVLLGVVGFPLLFDTQPRPVSVDIPIDIPDRGKAAPLPAPATAAGPSVVAAAPSPSVPAAAAHAPAASGLDAGEEIVQSTPHAESRPVPAPAPVAAPVPAPQPIHTPPPAPAPARTEPAKPEPARAETRPAATRSDDAARARALLEGRSPSVAATPVPAAPTPAQEGRFIVQVGAFGEAEKAREVRAKLERAGLKTYAQEVQTKDGKRIRVRVGPFAARADADKAAARIKGLDLPAAVFAL